MTHVATDDSFARDVLEADVPVLVDFTAPWCRPCRAIEPILDELAAEHEGRLRLVRLDVDANLRTPSRYGVPSDSTGSLPGRGLVIPMATGLVLAVWALHLRFLARAARPEYAEGIEILG